MRFETACVVGLGYIGLPIAATFAVHGLRVLGVDTNPHILEHLRAGEVHIYEPGLRELVQSALQSGNLNVDASVQAADVFIIAVPTPIDGNQHADMSAVIAATESIVPHLSRGSLVMLESTSPPRTTVDLLRPILERSGLRAGADFFLAYTPERVLPGQILHELIENARVIGGIDAASAEAGRDLYGLFVRGEILLTDATTAETVKLMENTYRDVNIAIANEFARLAERLGVDIWEAIALANRHPRVRILSPGTGVGGHCIGVDPWFLADAAPDLTPLIRAARAVNDSQPSYIVDWMRRTLGDLRDVPVAALGLAYKEDIDDLRGSPAIEVCSLLAQSGVRIIAYEPYRPDYRNAEFEIVTTLAAALHEAEIILLLTGHSALRHLEPFVLAQLTPARVIVDCRNVWNAAEWREFGFRVYALGTGLWA